MSCAAPFHVNGKSLDLDEKITPKTGLAFLADPLALWALGFAVLSLTLLPFDRDLVRILNPATPGPADSVALFMDHLLPRILLGRFRVRASRV